MTDYTPTTEEVRESFASGVNFESRTPFLSGRKQFDRWLAAHDAEVRAAVVAEGPRLAPGTYPYPGKRHDDDGIGLLGGAPRW